MEEKITKEQMVEAINGSGYLMEQRVQYLLMEKGYHAQTNDAYLDEEKNKSQEIDVTAYKPREIIKDKQHRILSWLLVECENNKQPIVFFRSKAPYQVAKGTGIKMIGLPIMMYKNSQIFAGLSHFSRLVDKHHYYENNVCSQYCSFHSPKNRIRNG